MESLDLDKHSTADYVTYRWVNFKETKTPQGIFTMTWGSNQNWQPSDSVSIDSNGVIVWAINEPRGTLMKYPDGVKRFIKIEL